MKKRIRLIFKYVLLPILVLFVISVFLSQENIRSHITKPKVEKEFFVKKQLEYEKFINYFIENKIGCIENDDIYDNNSNIYQLETLNNYRGYCGKGISVTDINELYNNLYIGSVNSYQNYIELYMTNSAGKDSSLFYVYITDESGFDLNYLINTKRVISYEKIDNNRIMLKERGYDKSIFEIYLESLIKLIRFITQ